MFEESKNEVIIIANSFQTAYSLNLVNGLSEHCKVTFICSDAFNDYKFNSNVTVENLRGDLNTNVSPITKTLRILKYYYKLFGFIRKSKIKVLHIQWLRFYLIDGLLFNLFAHMFDKKIVYTAHDILPHDGDTWLNRKIFKIVYKFQDDIVVHTAFLKDRLHNEFKIPNDKIYVIEHGVYDVQQKEETTFKMARDHYNLMEDDFVILFFGRLAKYKGVELIGSAINNFNSENRNVKLIIAGAVSPDYEHDFNTYLKSIDVTNIITHLGFIEDEEVEFLFKTANVTILPYKETSQSGVLFLSYAYHVPVIVPKIGGFPDYVISEKTGLVYDPTIENDFEDTIYKAMQLFNKPNNEVSENIKEFANTNFSWSVSAKKLCEIYKS